ncbi:Uncharacterized protein dnm_068150 [Desulfonema magnum]|uniref:Uncharacterized protein n=1 Tax=Desulfonema magnum TaxID=45655 RepID=A0A975BRY2_9BACT|nr:Uncharacterized protein dnm_068150 [Desulfonema magnum]
MRANKNENKTVSVNTTADENENEILFNNAGERLMNRPEVPRSCTYYLRGEDCVILLLHSCDFRVVAG